jgi:iron complex outermembrane receptor protein
VPGSLRLAALAALAALAPPLASAQPASAADPAPPPAAEPAPPAPSAEPAPQRVEVTGGRARDIDERRESTASKIVIGRDEIERFGDSTVGEVLKRLPGVTIGGTPGRGGAPRLRGLGSGYTQILIDGQRLPRGFSLDALSPEQIERIEVIRAPTAETGARAIAGTINIVTREGLRRRLHELKLTAGVENARLQPGLNWNFDDSAGDLSYSAFASVFRNDQRSQSLTTTVDTPLAGGEPLRVQQESATSDNQNQGLRAGGRLQWRLGDGESLSLQPFVVRSASDFDRATRLEQTVGVDAPPYATSASRGSGDFALERLNGQWRKLLADGTRLEWTANGSQWRSDNNSQRQEFDAAGALLRTVDDRSSVRERRFGLNGKGTRPLGEVHSLVGGFELEGARRDDTRTTLQDGVPLLPEFGENLKARSTRTAVYLQDEWPGSARWSFGAGLRWEGIDTRGENDTGEPEQRNTSSVWSPLLHAVWKPDPKGRDQWRFALTRSYRSPALPQLISRPALNPRFPVDGPNEPTSPDRAGNPALRPELATGIDVAFERYLPASGVLSANVFVRRITDLIRSETTLENVSWSDVPRWVSRPRNVGDATTRGLELEAKFRLSEVWANAPPIDLRANASAFRSSVDGVPGPDNRLDEQPDFTANLGADWRLRGWPLAIGGNLNLTPGYRTTLSATERTEVSDRRVFDAYALWTVNRSLQWRLSASNLAPRDGEASRSVDTDLLRETATTVSTSYVSWQLRLEMKL